MLTLVVHEKGGRTRRVGFGGDQFTVGRDEENHLVLDRTNVSKHHIRFQRRDGAVELIDLESTNGTYVNGRKLRKPMPIRRSDRIYVGDYILMLDGDDSAILPRTTADVGVEAADGRLTRTSIALPAPAGEAGQPLPGVDPPSAGGGLLDTSARRVGAPGSDSATLDGVARAISEAVLANVSNLDPLTSARPSKEDRREAVALVDALLAERKSSGDIEEGADTNPLRRRVISELVELGPLTPLMARDEVREIQVVGAGPIRVVRENEQGAATVGVSDLSFTGNRAVALAMQRIARRRGFLVEGSNILEGRADNGFYMYGLLPPNQVNTPVISLRRTRTDAKNLDALVQEGVLGKNMAELLSAAIRGCRRVVVCASGGVNLDRFMGAMIGEIPDELRVACISDAGRLGADRAGWIQVRRISEPSDAIALSDALGVLLRGGLDLLVSQRCRHEDAAAVIDALSGAVTGTIVSVWGIDSAHALSRLAALSTVASGAIQALTISLARSVDLLVRVGAGVNSEAMQVREIIEPRVREGNKIAHVGLFKAARAGDGSTHFTATGTVPHFVQAMSEAGVVVPVGIFRTS
ncbi:MAG: FHA domain-containing protein [Nannocystaceae bacterium]